jgi:murein DD-endopeptidase MepM/ murein hydrolase activator NlpD
VVAHPHSIVDAPAAADADTLSQPMKLNFSRLRTGRTGFPVRFAGKWAKRILEGLQIAPGQIRASGFLLLLAGSLLGCSGNSGESLISDVQVIRAGAAEGELQEAVPTALTPPLEIGVPTEPVTTVGASREASESPAQPESPLKFTFPTAMPPPISAWRPPLYEIPWAPTPHDHFYFARPIAADEINWPLENYRYGGVFFEDIIHAGVDITAPYGTPVIAAAPGRVVRAGYGVYSGNDDPDDPYGLAVVIKHDFGYDGSLLYSVYGHLSQVDVVKGQEVQTGDLLGLVGNTGFTTGPHLHFEIRIGDNRFLTTRNPELWIAPPIGWGVLVGRVLQTNGRPAYSQLVYVQNVETDQLWRVISYGKGPVNPDPYYQENLVIGDLPAGVYRIRIAFYGTLFEQEIQILPGRVSYFTFEGYKGFGDSAPPPLDSDFIPPN